MTTLCYALRLYRCLVCGRVRLFHTPRQTARCDRAPLPFTITPAGRARLADLERGEGKTLEVGAEAR
jgi:hypothetical protein